jgi:hypothetical protein
MAGDTTDPDDPDEQCIVLAAVRAYTATTRKNIVSVLDNGGNLCRICDGTVSGDGAREDAVGDEVRT